MTKAEALCYAEEASLRLGGVPIGAEREEIRDVILGVLMYYTPKTATMLPYESDSFVAAWKAWASYRKQRRKPLTQITEERQLAKLKAMGLERAVACINHSLEMGYEGLYEPKGDRGRAAVRPGRSSRVGPGEGQGLSEHDD